MVSSPGPRSPSVRFFVFEKDAGRFKRSFSCSGGRRGLSPPAIENYSQYKRKKRRRKPPETVGFVLFASRAGGDPTSFLRSKAGAESRKQGGQRDSRLRGNDEGPSLIVAGGPRLELDVIFDAHALDHLELLFSSST